MVKFIDVTGITLTEVVIGLYIITSDEAVNLSRDFILNVSNALDVIQNYMGGIYEDLQD